MAITFKLDEDQLQAIVNEGAALSQEVRSLSENIGKWQGQTHEAIAQGFADLVAFLDGGKEEELQQRLDALAERMDQSSDKVEDAIKHAKGE